MGLSENFTRKLSCRAHKKSSAERGRRLPQSDSARRRSNAPVPRERSRRKIRRKPILLACWNILSKSQSRPQFS